jgi:hypothetical protein
MVLIVGYGKALTLVTIKIQKDGIKNTANKPGSVPATLNMARL